MSELEALFDVCFNGVTEDDMKRETILSFVGGQLSIQLKGYGEGDGDGRMTFAYSDMEYLLDGDHQAPLLRVMIKKSELIAIRDLLNEVFPLEKEIDAYGTRMKLNQP